jgi:hypothetical protein
MVFSQKLGTSATLAAAIALAASSVAWAKPPAPPEPAIAVVAHVPLDGAASAQMFVREGPKNEILLYVVQEAGRGVSVVDVTKPARAALVRRIDVDAPGMGGQVFTIGTNTVAVESDGAPAPPAPALRTVRLFDLSNPAAPRVALQYEHVSGYILDASRNLVYLVNNEGLWIIRHNEPMDWKTKAWWDFATAP